MKHNDIYIKHAHMSVVLSENTKEEIFNEVADLYDDDNITVSETYGDGGSFRCSKAAVHANIDNLYEVFAHVINNRLESMDASSILEDHYNVDYEKGCITANFIEHISNVNQSGKLITLEFDIDE